MNRGSGRDPREARAGVGCKRCTGPTAVVSSPWSEVDDVKLRRDPGGIAGPAPALEADLSDPADGPVRFYRRLLPEMAGQGAGPVRIGAAGGLHSSERYRRARDLRAGESAEPLRPRRHAGRARGPAAA